MRTQTAKFARTRCSQTQLPESACVQRIHYIIRTTDFIKLLLRTLSEKRIFPMENQLLSNRFQLPFTTAQFSHLDCSQLGLRQDLKAYIPRKLRAERRASSIQDPHLDNGPFHVEDQKLLQLDQPATSN